MPRPLNASIIARKNRLDEGTWYWLIEVELNETEILRLTTNNETVSWDSESWYPFRGSVGSLQESADGNSITREITLSPIGEYLGPLLAAGRGLRGRSVILREVENSLIADPTALVSEYIHVVSEVEIDMNQARFTLSLDSVLRSAFPPDIIGRTCRFVYGGPECGYDLTTGNLPYCSHTLKGENGCEAHGADEAALALPVNHPTRFGGFASLPRRT